MGAERHDQRREASNGDTVAYSAAGLSALGLSINATTGVISGQISLSAAQTTPYSITITATDATTSATSSQSFTWMVNPALSLTSPGPQTTVQGANYTLDLAAKSNIESGGSVEYTQTGLPGDFTLNGLTAQITGSGSAADVAHGPYTITITASQDGVSATQVFTLTVTSPVRLLNPGPQMSAAGMPVLLSLAASDNNDAGAMTYSVTGLPSGLTYNAGDGLISGIAAAASRTPYTVVVTASDSSGSASQTFSWLVTPPPQIAIIDSGPQWSLVGNFVMVPIAALDPFGGAVSYSAAGLPNGLSINPTTGLIMGTVGNFSKAGATTGTYSVTITAVDGNNSATDTFQWTVNAPPAPVAAIANPGPLVSPAGLPVSVTLQAYQPAGSSLTWNITGQPTGMTVSGATISGTPTAAGNFVVSARLMNGSTVVATTSFSWQVTATGVAFVPNQTSTEGQFVSLQLQGAGTGLTWSAAGLPSGLTLNSQTGVISGTIAANTAGIYVVDVSAVNGSNGGSQSFAWIVNPAVSLTAINNQTSIEGQAVAIQVQANEPDADLTYQAWGLPAGVTINSSTGLISGTPAPGTAIQGGYMVTVKVGDGTYSNALSFAWLVNPATTPAAPVEAKEPNQTSVAGQVVNLNLNSYDPAGYSYIEAVNNLPDGLSLNPTTGAITGIVADDAVSPVPYNVSVVLGDGLGNTVTERFKWSVEPTALTAQVYPINATAGTSTGTIIVGSFTTTDLAATASEFIVAINWGGGILAEIRGRGQFRNSPMGCSGSLTTRVSVWGRAPRSAARGQQRRHGRVQCRRAVSSWALDQRDHRRHLRPDQPFGRANHAVFDHDYRHRCDHVGDEQPELYLDGQPGPVADQSRPANDRAGCELYS